MTGDDLSLGVVGTSEGNGHPYSFASIVNGYRPDAFDGSGWEGILAYLEERDRSEVGLADVEVTHAWTQDRRETDQLAAAARIPNPVRDLESLVDADLDGVLLLRDDHESHLELAKPFLDADVPLFVDKPLTCDSEDLRAFEPHLAKGRVSSCSGLRYARELDGPRRTLDPYGELRVVRGTVLFDLARYGIHVLEPILAVVDARPVAVQPVPAAHESIVVETDADYPIKIDALGDAPPTFHVDLYGSERETRHELGDNFQAFRRTLSHFVDAVRTGEPMIPPEHTLDVVRTIIAARRAIERDERIRVDSVGG